MSTVDILTIAGMVIYLLGGLVITLPGIVIFEKYHPPGRLLRGIETLEAEPITKDETGFEELREAINDIVKGEYQIGNDIYELDYYSGEVGLGGRMVEYKIVKREKNSNKNIRIEEPAFEKIRYQIYRKVR